MSESKNTLLLQSADHLAQSVGAMAILSFLPRDRSLLLTTPVVNVLDAQPEILRDPSLVSLVDYCSNRVMDAVVQYRTVTNTNRGTVVAVFPCAILIYDIESMESEFSVQDYKDIVDPDILHAVLTLAVEIAHDGREGRAVGTAFIVGDIEELKRWSHQSVLNPFEGHPEEVRDVLNKANWETVKEFSLLDGVFLIGKNGIIEAAGRYLDADGCDAGLQSGLGGRHLATAAITKVTPSVGVAVSESGGVIRVFYQGKTVTMFRTDMRLEF